MKETLAGRGAIELSGLMARRETSAVEVLEDHLAAIERINPSINAIVTLAAESALAEARRLDGERSRGEVRGPLHGLPVVIKDVTPTKGMRTTYGSMAYADHIPDQDAEVVRRLRLAGAIILGKTNTPEFAAGANTVNEVFGATCNPWRTDLSPAGSSGGSAASVAAGLVPLAQGTDFGCSIRIPASFCGIVGVRTTPGLVPNGPMRLPWDPGQVHGPLARSSEDAALMIDAMIGLDPYWPISAAPPWGSALDIVRASRSCAGLRVAFARDIAGFGLDEEVEKICRSAAFALKEAGAEVEEIDLDASDGFEAYKTLRGEWMVGQQFERLGMLDQFGVNLKGNVLAGLKLTTLQTAEAEQVREKVWARFKRHLEVYDYILTPASPVLPYSLTKAFPDEIGRKQLDNYIDWIAPCFLVTFTGFPAASIPAGLTASGLPVGIQIVGRRFDEPGILSVGKSMEALRPIGRPAMFAC